MKEPAVQLGAAARPAHPTSLTRTVLWSAAWLLAGALFAALAYQLPARHGVEVGRDDEAYVQGFEDAVNRWGVVTDQSGVARPFRWSGPQSALIFPQIGLPARATIRWRAWRPPGEPLPRVRVLLNGDDELGSFQTTGGWEEHNFTLTGGLWKPRDLFLQLQVDPVLEQVENRRGVQVDRALIETSHWPIVPYPAQVVGGGLATLLAAVVLRRHARWLICIVVVMHLLWLAFYRLQLTPYPVRLFWPLLVGLWASLAIGQRLEANVESGLAQRILGRYSARRTLADACAAAAIVLWSLGLWWASRRHVVLSVPGVENDFRVFATRSNALVCPGGVSPLDAGCVLRADGFYQLGYPFLLWLVRPLTAGNAFLAGQVVAILATAALLLGAYLLGRALLGPLAGLLPLIFVALNRSTTEYALYVGTDMPFAAAWTLALALLLARGEGRGSAWLAGAFAGLAFLTRHPGILLLPLGCALLIWKRGGHSLRSSGSPWRRWDRLGSFLLAFGVLSLPQIVVNVAATGDPLFSQQAKNIWLGVYGNTDWRRWDEASNDVTLSDIIAHEPGRFFANWWGNFRAFWGTGSEDPSEFGRAVGLRVLAFPANLLALGGLMLWLLHGDWRERLLLVVAVLYVSTVALAFMLPRFVLPLVPIWGVAAGAALRYLWRRPAAYSASPLWQRRIAASSSLVLGVLLAGAPAAGVRMVVGGQDADAVAATVLVRQTLVQGERVVEQLPPEDALPKYSSIAHLVTTHGDPAARYLLSDNPQSGGRLLGRAGRYFLYRLSP